jgi:hypothetical protein
MSGTDNVEKKFGKVRYANAGFIQSKGATTFEDVGTLYVRRNMLRFEGSKRSFIMGDVLELSIVPQVSKIRWKNVIVLHAVMFALVFLQTFKLPLPVQAKGWLVLLFFLGVCEAILLVLHRRTKWVRVLHSDAIGRITDAYFADGSSLWSAWGFWGIVANARFQSIGTERLFDCLLADCGIAGGGLDVQSD